MAGLIGKKLGMTRIVTESGVVPVSVISVAGNRVCQVKTSERDGYVAVQMAAGQKSANG